MAEQTIQLPSFNDRDSSGFRGWRWSQPSIVIDDSLLQNSNDNRYLQIVGMTREGAVTLGFSSSTSSNTSGADLSDAFETNGGIDITLSGTTYSFELAGADFTEPYQWTVTNTADAAAFYDAFESASPRDGTLVLRDGPPVPDASAGNASVSINTIANGNEGTSVQLGATLTKGTGVYDTASYAWTASSGTLTGANTATPTWTRPSVSSNTDVTIRLTVTLSGDGTTAKTGTSVSLAQVTRTATVLDVLPAAAAPTVSINAVAAGDEGTTVTLGASVGAGGQYDGSITYAWSVDEGTLNDASAATPVWTRPSVTATKTVDINLRITVSGDGTTTRSGTSASRNAAETSATVRNVLPAAIAPNVSIDSIAAGDEGTSVALTATITGGAYDSAITYAWSVDEGTLSNAASASPTWTRPAVSATKTVDVNLRVTVSGTGGFAQSGTTASRDAAEVSATVRNVLPAASAGNASVAINAISAGDEGTSVNLSATVTKGTGVYDSVAYAWTADEGTLSGADTATPTWTRPTVTATKNVTLRLVLTLQGTGTTARSGTSVALSEVTRSASVRDIPDVTSPFLQSVATDETGALISLTYNETLDNSSIPAAGDFTFSPSRTISVFSVAGSVVTLSVSTAFMAGETITLDYTVGTNPIQDLAGNDAASFSGEAVTNNVPLPYQVFDLEADEYLVGTVSKRWLKNPRPLVNANLSPVGQTRYLDLVVARREDDRGGVFHFEPASFGTRTSGHDLSAQVESAGIFRITVGDTYFDFPANLDSGGDEPYVIDFSGDTQTAYNTWQEALSTTEGSESGTFTIWNGLEPSPFAQRAIVGQPMPIAQVMSVSQPEGVDPRASAMPITQELAVDRISSLTYAPPLGSQLPRTRTLDLGTPSDLFGQDQWTGRRDVGPFAFYEIFASPTTIRVIVVPTSGWVSTGSITLTGRAGAVELAAADAAQGGSGGIQGGITLTWTTAPARAWGAAQNALTDNNGVTLGVIDLEFVPFLAHDVEAGRPIGYIPIIGRPLALIQAVGRPHAYAHAEFVQQDLALARPIALVRRAVQPIALTLNTSLPYPYAHADRILQGQVVGRPIALVKRAVQPVAIEQAVGMVQGIKPATGSGQPIALAMALGNPRGYLPSVGARPITQDQSVSRPHAYAHAEFIQTDLAVGRPIAKVERGIRSIEQIQDVGRPQTYAHVASIATSMALGRPSAARPPKIGIPGRLVSDTQTADVGTPLSSTATFVSYINGSSADYTVTEVVAFGSQINIRITKFLPDWPANGTLTFTSSNGSVTVPGGTPNQFNQIVYTGLGTWVRSLLALDRSDQDLTVTFDISEFQPYLAADLSVGMPEPEIRRVGLPKPLILEQGLSRPHAYTHAEFIQTDMAVGRPITLVKRAVRPVSIENGLSRPHTFAHAEFAQIDLAVGKPIARVKRALRPISLDMAVGKVQGLSPREGETSPIILDMSLSRPIGLIRRAVQPITSETAVGRPAAIIFGVPGSIEAGMDDASETEDLGVRNRTRGGGSIWEWNDGFTLSTPIVNADDTSVAAVRLRNNQVRIINSGNDDPGFSDEFKAGGTLMITHVGGSSFTFSAPSFDNDGRVDLSDEPNWAAWWNAFAQDATNELRITFSLSSGQFLPFLAANLTVGRPHAYAHAEFIQIDMAVGRPAVEANINFLPIAIEQSTSRPHAYAHAEFVQTDVGVGRPIVLVKRAIRPLIGNLSTSRPHAFSHAEFIQTDVGVGRPVVLVKRAIRPITLDSVVERIPVGVKRAVQPIVLGQAVSRPHAFAHTDSAVVEQAVSRPRGYLPSVAAIPLAVESATSRPHGFAHAEFILSEQSVGRPRGYIPRVAATQATLENATSRPYAFAHAEFVQTDLAVGRPIARISGAAEELALEQSVGRPIAQVKRAIQAITVEGSVSRPRATLFGVPGSATEGETVTESHDFGARTLVRTDANGTWQWNTNLTLPEPFMTATAATIAQVHVRANQVRFIRTGGQNPGFSDAFNRSGIMTLTNTLTNQTFTITGPNFDHLGRMDPSGLPGYSAWWTAFSTGTAGELAIRWQLTTSGFQPFLAGEVDLSRPHAFSHAEFILEESVVGRPIARVKRAIRPITLEAAVGSPTVDVKGEPFPIAQEAVTGRPHAYSHVSDIGTEQSVGRPRGYLPKVAAQAISYEHSISRPHGFAHAEFIQTDMALGRPNAFVKRAMLPITLEAVADSISVIVKRAVNPIVLAQATSRPHAFAHAEFVQTDLAVGRPRGYLPKVAAGSVAVEGSLSRPHGFAHAEFVQTDLAVGRPRSYIARVAAVPLVQEQVTARPHAYSHAEFILEEYEVGRPIGQVNRGIRPIDNYQAVGRPIAQVKRAVQPLVAEQLTGRAAAILFGVPGFTSRGITATEVYDFGTPDRVRANGAWWFDVNLTLPEPIMAESASPITSFRLRGSQIRIIASGGENPGFSNEFSASGRMILTNVGGSTITVTGPDFDDAGRLSASGITGYAAWWTEISSDATNELSVTWELDTSGFQPYLAQDQAVSRPHGFAHAEFILLEHAVGTPGVSTSRAVQAISGELGVSRPHAFAHAEFILSEYSVGRPQGRITKVAARPIAAEQATSRPHAFSHAEFIQTDVSVGRPIAQVKRAVQPIAQENVTGQPIAQVKRAVRAIANELAVAKPIGAVTREGEGRPIAVEAAVGRPRGYIPAVAARAISSDLSLSRPHGFAHAEFIQTDVSVGRPRGYIPAVAARGISVEGDLSRPHAFAHAEFILVEQAVGRPITFVSQVVMPITEEQRVGRPHAFTHGRDVAVEQSVERPVALVKRAVQPIVADHAVGRPVGQRRRIARGLPITSEQSLGRPIVLVKRAIRPIVQDQVTGRPATVVHLHGLPIVTEQQTGRPRGYLPSVAALPISVDGDVSRVVGEKLRSGIGVGITVDMFISRPRGFVQAVPSPNTLIIAISRPQRYFPRRNSEAQVAADYEIDPVMTLVTDTGPVETEVFADTTSTSAKARSRAA